MKTIFLKLIRLYQIILSPWVGNQCRFYPTCSNYAKEAIEKHGVIKGGYFDGLENAPKPNGNRSKSYYHGWRNGMMDRGNIQIDNPARKLASEYVKNEKDKSHE